MEDYIGKICPFCKTEIKEGDSVKACPACGIPSGVSRGLIHNLSLYFSDVLLYNGEKGGRTHVC